MYEKGPADIGGAFEYEPYGNLCYYHVAHLTPFVMGALLPY
jgi:hypothetical protein